MSIPGRVGAYEILAEIAAGGMGVVYLARRGGVAGFRRLVALKQMHERLAGDPSFVAMFKDEARVAALIHHPNVVAIHEIGEAEGSYFVVMDFIEGASLAHLHGRAVQTDGALPRAVAVRIVLDALAGLDAAHELVADDGSPLALVHRDVSPQNVLVGADGLSRLTDFGIAKAKVARSYRSIAGEVKGKVEYMAPEQLASKPLDRRADLFAMGIVLWELLTSRRLFAAKKFTETIERITSGVIPPPRTVVPSIGPELDAVCMRALERDPMRRIPTAAAFAEQLERAARDDAGIATHREVAATMDRLLGPAIRHVRAKARELGAKPEPPAAPASLADDAVALRPTQQLPFSDPWAPRRPAPAPEQATAPSEPPSTELPSTRIPTTRMPPTRISPAIAEGGGPTRAALGAADEGPAMTPTRVSAGASRPPADHVGADHVGADALAPTARRVEAPVAAPLLPVASTTEASPLTPAATSPRRSRAVLAVGALLVTAATVLAATFAARASRGRGDVPSSGGAPTTEGVTAATDTVSASASTASSPTTETSPSSASSVSSASSASSPSSPSSPSSATSAVSAAAARASAATSAGHVPARTSS